MPYPSRLLGDGEEVMVDTRPHGWVLAPAAAAVVVVLAGAVTAYVAGVPRLADWALLALVVVALLWLGARYARWASTSLVVTNQRVVFRRGVWGRASREVPIVHVSDVSYRQSLWGRVIRCGDLIVESAARDGREVFVGVPHPEAVQREIYRALNDRHQRQGGTGLSVAEQIERLDDLRRRGALTQAEFDRVKSQLLGGR